MNGKSILAALLIVLVSATAMLSSGCIYRVDTGEAGIYTSAGGEKSVETGVGWHLMFPMLSDIKIYKIINNNIYFPSDYLVLQEKFAGDTQTGAIGMDIRAADDKVVDTSAKMTYRISDLQQYGIFNTNPQQQLQDEMDSIIYGYLQSQTSDRIVGDVENISNEILTQMQASQIEERYGIVIEDFALLRPTYTKAALDAMAEKQAMQAKSEGELIAAQNQANAIRTITDAQQYQAQQMQGVPADVLDFNAKLAMYEALKDNPGVIWVIPQGQAITLTK